MTTDFARSAIAERARLALIDPEGEAEAVAPLTGVRARQILLGYARPTRPTPARQGETGRDLLTRLGCDPNRTSGRIPCPAHGGRDRNLAWRLTPDGIALFKCHSHQCSFEDIVR